jgi:uncharacterized Tic20 family protein
VEVLAENKELSNQNLTEKSSGGEDLLTTSSDERTWAAIAHLCTLLNSVTAMGGLVGAGFIYLSKKDESKWIAFHALQSLVFQGIQLALYLLLGIVWILGFAASFITFGLGTLIAAPVLILATFFVMMLSLAGLIYSLYGAYQIYSGYEFYYLWIGDWVMENYINKDVT